MYVQMDEHIYCEPALFNFAFIIEREDKIFSIICPKNLYGLLTILRNFIKKRKILDIYYDHLCKNVLDR